MVLSKSWKIGTSFCVALGMSAATALPLMTALPAAANSPSFRTAQLFRGDRVLLPAGTEIFVRYDDAERIILRPNETSDLTLTVAEDVRSSVGTIVIRAGSQVEGKLRPVGNGTQFVAENLIPVGSDRRLPIDATSQVVTRRETITRRTDPNYLRGAAVGAATAAVLSEVFGRINLGEVLAGAGAGVLAEIFLLRRTREVEVTVVEPNRDLDLTLEGDFVVQRVPARPGRPNRRLG